ncbi:MAG TPA: RNA polymerase sigma factor [Gammaproteobacteria bacterium]|nr:RNA polymerase sigma factor [Gammaproteobacteria bacterium]HJP38295.1 RNA polymerase sigma factor [Gammaproteobacteria bacterium]
MSTYLLTMTHSGQGREQEDRTLDQRRAMDRFLSAVEQRAFCIARIAVRDTDDALDIVQDAMIRLVRSYARRPEVEWAPIFFRILQNRIRDHQRHQSVRRRVLAWFSRSDDDEAIDPIAQAPDLAAVQPDHQLALDDAMSALEDAVHQLPARQQQAFLLRTVECMDVASTAKAMGCSDGSVKTHYSRAVRSLRATVGVHWEDCAGEG